MESNKVFETINNITSKIYIKYILVLILSIILGNTLTPMPLWISELFKTSNTLKFIILVLFSFVIFNPITFKKIIVIFIVCFSILFFMELARKEDIYKFIKEFKIKIKN